MAKEYRHQFTVQGHLTFPVDMLRYDACWPKTEAEDVPAIADSLNPLVKTQTYTIRMVGCLPPTEGRWASFGWKVLSGSISRYALT